VAVLKAMGTESDQEIVQMVGRDPKFAGILAPSLQAHYLPSRSVIINVLMFEYVIPISYGHPFLLKAEV
jgi:hypothetical protein